MKIKYCKDLLECNNYIQFFLSVFPNLLSSKIYNININKRNYIQNFQSRLKEFQNKLPKNIVFKNDQQKNSLVPIIRKLFIFSFFKSKLGYGIINSVPLNFKNHIHNKLKLNDLFCLIYKNAFTILVGNKTFNVCRNNRYSKNDTHLIYDWKEINKLQDTLSEYNLSIEKLWNNIFNEFKNALLVYFIYTIKLMICEPYYQYQIGNAFPQLKIMQDTCKGLLKQNLLDIYKVNIRF